MSGSSCGSFVPSASSRPISASSLANSWCTRDECRRSGVSIASRRCATHGQPSSWRRPSPSSPGDLRSWSSPGRGIEWVGAVAERARSGLILAFLLMTSCTDRFVDVRVQNGCPDAVTFSVWASADDPDAARADALPRQSVEQGASVTLDNGLAAPPGLPGATLLLWNEDGTWVSVPVAEPEVELPDLVNVVISPDRCPRR